MIKRVLEQKKGLALEQAPFLFVLTVSSFFYIRTLINLPLIDCIEFPCILFMKVSLRR